MTVREAARDARCGWTSEALARAGTTAWPRTQVQIYGEHSAVVHVNMYFNHFEAKSWTVWAVGLEQDVFGQQDFVVQWPPDQPLLEEVMVVACCFLSHRYGFPPSLRSLCHHRFSLISSLIIAIADLITCHCPCIAEHSQD